MPAREFIFDAREHASPTRQDQASQENLFRAAGLAPPPFPVNSASTYKTFLISSQDETET